jgi:hypothetical protein
LARRLFLSSISEVGVELVARAFDVNWLGKKEQQIVSNTTVPTGRHVLGMRFEVTGHEGPSPAGTATLYVDHDEVATANIKIQPGHFSLAGEGINAGRDAGQPVSSEYKPPFGFTGGTLHQVLLERTDEPYVDLERHYAAAFARD